MIRKFTLWVLTAAVAVFVAIANASAASACNIVYYQPELPKSLRK